MPRKINKRKKQQAARMTPDQYRREGAEAMKNAAVIEAEDCFVGAQAIRAIDIDEVLAGMPPAPDTVAQLVEAANQSRLALAGYVSAQSAINMLDNALAEMETDQ